jgi:hypothetical protein
MDFSNIMGFFTLPFIVFCVMIYIATRFFRFIIEYPAKKMKSLALFLAKFLNKITPKSKNIDIKWVNEKMDWLWKENILPAAPIVIGSVMSYFLPDYPYPDVFGTTLSARVFLGAFAGLICMALYPRFNYYFKKYLNKKADDLEDKIKVIEENKE